MSQGELLINGAWVQGKGTSFIKTNPVSNQQIGLVMKLVLLMLRQLVMLLEQLSPHGHA